jgi:hypothetical protein
MITTMITHMITMGLTTHIEDVAKGIMENVAKEIMENMAEDMDVAIANAEEETVEGETMVEDIKEDLIRRNAISASNLGAGQTNIP